MGARVIVAAVCVLVAPAMLACGSSRSATAPGDGGGAGPVDDTGTGPAGAEDGPEPQPAAPDGGVAAACDDFFDALVACSLVLPATAAHDGPRFRQYCENQASLPGSTTTAANIEACAQAYTADCSSMCGLPNSGTLPAGTRCNIGWDLQCQSGVCAEVALPDGGYSASCGVCATSLPVGQPCSNSGTGACVQGSYCAGATSEACVAYGDAGAACSQSLLCKSDLFCSSSHQCVAQGALGAACSVDPNQTECAAGLPCVAGLCAKQAAAGEPCTPSGWAVPCENALTCDTTTLTCVAPTVQPGGACGANGQLCVFGSCSKTGICPTIIPDGQPCPVDDTETCDDEATCDATGKCSIPGNNACP
jgi:hypothetical protein